MGSSTGSRGFSRWSLAGCLVALSMAVTAESLVTPGSKAAGLDACVAPIAEIRRDHMVYLQHDRVETVRNGVRDLDYSLAGCIDCHAAKDDKGNYQPVDAQGQFCASCHDYVAVAPACFQCHSSKPEQRQSVIGSALDTTGPEALGLLRPGDPEQPLSEQLRRPLSVHLQERGS